MLSMRNDLKIERSLTEVFENSVQRFALVYFTYWRGIPHPTEFN